MVSVLLPRDIKADIHDVLSIRRWKTGSDRKGGDAF